MTEACPNNPIDLYLARETEAGRSMSKSELARRAGVSRNIIYRLIHGDEVSVATFEQFERATDGALSALDLFAHWQARRDAASQEVSAQ